jgi:hypothetical protein
MPYEAKLANIVVRLLTETGFVDDVSKLELVQGIVEWSVPMSTSGFSFIWKIASSLGSPQSFSDWLCWFVFLSKYGMPSDALNAYEASRAFRRKEAFLARQAVALLCRAAVVNAQRVRNLWDQEVSTGYMDSASVAVNLITLAGAGYPSKSHRLYPYLFPTKQTAPYPTSKFLLLCLIAAHDSAKGITTVRPEVKKFITDPWMRNEISSINPNWLV